MVPETERIESLYEISLAIGRGSTLEETLEEALAAYLQKLDCQVGAVFERRAPCSESIHYELVHAVPDDPQSDPTYEAARRRILGRAHPASAESLDCPVSIELDTGSYAYVFELPSFGVLVLGKYSCPLDDEMLTALDPLNQRLADACRRHQAEAKLREERNRFEAVFEAIQEPLVNVVFEGGEPIVQRVNPAFEQTFGYDSSTARGKNLNDLIVPEDLERSIDDPTRGIVVQSTNERDEVVDWHRRRAEIDEETMHSRPGDPKAAQLDEAAMQGYHVAGEVRRETVDGVGDFLFRGVPVQDSPANEHFGIYVDITEEKTQQRTLERLYLEAEEILAAESPTAVCERAITAAEEIIEFSLAGIHRYDRNTEALEPVATTTAITAVFEGQPRSYRNPETIVWEAYEAGEPIVIDDLDEFDLTIRDGESPMGSVIIMPLGRHGVFIVSSLDAQAFDLTDVRFTRLLARMVEIGLDRASREAGLAEMQAATRAALEADTHEAVASAVLERIEDVLDLPISGIFKYEAATNRLEPIATTDAARELLGEIPSFEQESIAWGAYNELETRVIADVSAHPSAHNPESPIRSEIIVPIEGFGVLITGSRRQESFAESEVHLVETLASNLETLLRLVDRRQELALLDQVLARILRHNLRNDLTAIQGFATNIADHASGDVAAQAERILDKCDDLARTATHAREMREIVRNRDERATVSLGQAAEHAAAVIGERYPDVEISLAIRSRAEVTCHPAITTAIEHLLENGITHNDTTDGIEVAVAVYEGEGDVIVEVVDNGPGIPPGELEVFDRHGESALDHGSGAGLWIVDRVAEYSGGATEFESANGTTARIRFPQ